VKKEIILVSGPENKSIKVNIILYPTCKSEENIKYIVYKKITNITRKKIRKVPIPNPNILAELVEFI